MNALDQLTARFREAAAKPPSMIGRTVAKRSLQIIATSVTDSRGRRRPIVRQTMAQQKALEQRAQGKSVEEAREAVLEQARKLLAP